MNSEKIFTYDTTLRDGTQQRGLSVTVHDKLKITEILDSFGIDYIEGGWPGSNPKDAEYFREVKALKLKHAKVVAFGSTRRAGAETVSDKNLLALVNAETPAVAVVGKSSLFHVRDVIRTTPEENIKMIEDSIIFLKSKNKEVIYDAEHFFDGYKEDSEYAISTVLAAQKAGANWIVLCDTNGGTLPEEVSIITANVSKKISAPIGIHTHNDCEMAVANSLAAINSGARQVQGTINGYGERCGNANLVSIIPTLTLKLGYRTVPNECLSKLTALSLKVSEIVNINHNAQAAFVGAHAFAHKGGIHVAAVERASSSYEHVNPDSIGNARDFVISELSGRGNIRALAAELGISLDGKELTLLERIKTLENEGYQFDTAEGSFELVMRREDPNYAPYFTVQDFLVVSEKRHGKSYGVEAVIKLKVGEELVHTAADGDGPVHALDCALRKALIPHYPEIVSVRLSDYKVRILNPDKATSAKTRVHLEASAENLTSWVTVGCSTNIIEASFQALTDAYELFLLRERTNNFLQIANTR